MYFATKRSFFYLYLLVKLKPGFCRKIKEDTFQTQKNRKLMVLTAVLRVVPIKIRQRSKNVRERFQMPSSSIEESVLSKLFLDVGNSLHIFSCACEFFSEHFFPM